jgi:predicted RNA-binding protein
LCESNVYLREEEGDKLVMEDAVLVESMPGGVKVTDILGDEKEIAGRIADVSFLDHRIIISPGA